uniref:Stromal cell-derived factor 1-like protein n=1 Tax=Callorhinchus milii TaxID=7868 RepID=V9KHA3_CALMI
MNVKTCALISLLIGIACINLSCEKPSSISYRCRCRGGTTRLHPGMIRKLLFLPIPNCPPQIIATLKYTGEQICIHPRTRWLRSINFFNLKSRM